MSVAKRIALIEASWHQDIVGQCFVGLADTLNKRGVDSDLIDRFSVPGSLEIPLAAKRLSRQKLADGSPKYALIVAAGLVIDGGIYRHDFVANAVLQGMMQVQLETDVPILSVVLTPHHFHEHDIHQNFFKEHFVAKGKEAGEACLQLLDADYLK